MPLKIGLEPSVKDVHELEFDVVMVSLAEAFVERRNHADHMRRRKPVRCRRNTEISIGGIAPQPAGSEVAFVQMTNRELLTRVLGRIRYRDPDVFTWKMARVLRPQIVSGCVARCKPGRRSKRTGQI